MTYALIENGTVAEYPVYEGDIKLRFPNTSFPLPFEPPVGYEAVVDVLPPAIDYTQVLTDGTPEYIDGVLTRVWVVSDASPELIAQRTEAQANQVRSDRNQRLAACDWTQLADSPLNAEAKAAWAFYRENLRMVPDQPGFPWNVQWPPQPGAN